MVLGVGGQLSTAQEVDDLWLSVLVVVEKLIMVHGVEEISNLVPEVVEQSIMVPGEEGQ